METIYVVAKLVIGWEEVGIATKIKMKEACDDGNVTSLLYRCQYLDCHFVFTAVNIFAKCYYWRELDKGYKVHVLCYFLFYYFTLIHTYFRI